MSHSYCCCPSGVWALWSCFHVAGDAVGSSALGQGCSMDWNESRRLPRLQLRSFCLPVKAKPKVKVNGQGCDCHLRWAREISSSLQTSEPSAGLSGDTFALPQKRWLLLLCVSNDFCRKVASGWAARECLEPLEYSSRYFNGWQCLIFTVCVYLIENCGYCSGCVCGAGSILLCDGCM